jgi:hypothetical protein
MKKSEKIFLSIIFSFTFICLGNCLYTLIHNYPNQFIKLLLSSLGCLFMLILIIFPLFFEKRTKFIIPNSMYILFIFFCFCGIVLGDVNDWYGKFESFDAILHFISGIILSVYGFIIVNTINHQVKNFKINPLFVAICAFCFAMTLGALWEVFEYTLDDAFGTNMQTYLETTSSSFPHKGDKALVGHEALKDTMTDIILNGAGGLVVCSIGYFDIKHGKKSFSEEILTKRT